MDILGELEAMAQNAMDIPNIEDVERDVPDDTVNRWQTLFGYAPDEASESIKRHRTNLTRPRVSDQHWALVREAKEAEGHDRESYEYSMTINQVHPASWAKSTEPTLSKSMFLLKLEGLLHTPEKIQEAAHLATPPQIHEGWDEDGHSMRFVILDAAAAVHLKTKFDGRAFQPTLFVLSKAEKDLLATSISPTLGVDSTLPQFRIRETDVVYPMQDQYPVWYFFYGTLAEPDCLARLLDLPTDPILREATITGGILKIWAGKYKALVDGPPSACVHGWAYEVLSQKHEESLQIYETSRYEVVRCRILITGKGAVQGLTFRFRD
ncbi:hypothetical protein PRK78_002579 [Emydomyces testavorans]|uniref:Putative gamma-glutamylcyclotransferase n=1 Tax=Emydomyces testavorans TaxID=2070801 RepID=A0AAF0IJS9_9EURO|nr:hypothetical protein PRK78_002579 [Emydomyces testavorans]